MRSFLVRTTRATVRLSSSVTKNLWIEHCGNLYQFIHDLAKKNLGNVYNVGKSAKNVSFYIIVKHLNFRAKNGRNCNFEFVFWVLVRKFKYRYFVHKRSSLRSQCYKMRLFCLIFIHCDAWLGYKNRHLRNVQWWIIFQTLLTRNTRTFTSCLIKNWRVKIICNEF